MATGLGDSGPVILALDIGLTNAKAVLFDGMGRILDRESLPYPTRRPAPGRVEQDPEAWLTAAAGATAALWRRAPQVAASVVAIGVTAHMHAVVCLGAGGRAQGPALVLGDRRAMRSADRVREAVGAAAVYRLTGAELDASMPAAKIAWILDAEPDIAAHTRAFVACKDFVRHRLTGDLFTDPIDACATSMFDIGTSRWSPTMLEAVGIDEARLPIVRPPESFAGALLPGSAAAFGLPAGLPVVVGSGDDVEVLGNGLLGPGESLEHLGTTGSILTVSDRLALDPDMRLELYPHAIPGLWVLGGSMTTAGAAIAAARDLLHVTPEAALLALAAAPEPVSADPVFLPDLAGQRCPVRVPRAKGGWLGLTSDTRPESLLAASFRGVAYGLRRILARIEELVGEQRVVTVSGGYDLDPAWLQLRADVYERPLALLETSEPTALGAAILAAAGIGLYPDVGSAVRATAQRVGSVEPGRGRMAALRRDYARFVRFNDALVDAWDGPDD